MFKSTLILALLVFVTGKNIEMYKAQLETPLPKDEVIVNMYSTIQLHYASHKTTQKKFDLPDIDTSSNESFVYSLNRCINYLYDYIEIEDRIPNELVIAQAVIETGWGKSRFANEGNNLFGIRRTRYYSYGESSR